MEAPTKILFSGNGSKFIEQLDPSKRKLSLVEYTAKIINYVYKQDLNTSLNIELITNENPKELTSKGAISLQTDDIADNKLNVREINNSFITYLGDINDTIVSKHNALTYSDLSQDIYSSVIQEYKQFIAFFLNQKEVDIRDLFNINFDLKGSLTKLLSNENRMREFLETGLSFRKKQTSESEKISDPLFFYIIRGVLGDLFQKLFENKN